MQDPAWTLLPISAVERETGIGKDTLRAWERRYGFPAPVRNDRGDRAYTWAQVERLRRVNRLIAAGHRPGALMQMSSEALEELARTEALASGVAWAPNGSGRRELDAAASLLPIDECLAVMRGSGSPGLRRWMLQALGAAGLAAFVRQGVAPLARALGESWLDGRIQVFEEHLVTEAVQAVLRHALLPLQAAADGRPRVLLTTVPGEEHLLGLLMAESLLTLAGASCIALGPATPPAEIVAAAAAERADIVALGFSERMPAARRTAALRDLRQRLDPRVVLWAGGAGVLAGRAGEAAGWQAMDLDDIEAALAAWRGAAGIQTAPASVSSSAGQTRRIE